MIISKNLNEEVAIFSGKVKKVQIYDGSRTIDNSVKAADIAETLNKRYGLNLTFRDLYMDERIDF